MRRNTKSKNLTALWFILLSITWGSSFLFIKLGLEEISPAYLVLLRLCFGAITLIAILFITRRRLPRELKLYLHLAVVGVFLCVLPLLLFAWAGQFIPSGLSAIFNATTPLMTLIIGLVIIPNEKLSTSRLVGIFIGGIGILTVLGPWQFFDSANPIQGTGLAQIACLLGTASYGIAFTWMRRFVSGKFQYDSPTLAAVQVGIAALLMVAFMPFIDINGIAFSPLVIVSVLILGIFGSGIAYIWNTRIVNSWGAAPAATVTYLSPLIGVILGVVVLNEDVSWNQPVGGVITVLGILITQKVLKWPSSNTSS